MNDIDKDLFRRLAPMYISAGIAVAVSLYQIRQITEERLRNREAHKLAMAEAHAARIERAEKHEAWRAAQPNLDQIMEKARQEVGTLDDLQRHMQDPNYVFEL